MPTAKIQPVYNLKFPAYCNELKIFGYVFKRVSHYESRLKKLHRVSGLRHEFDLEPITGTHNITASVAMPLKEFRSALPWEQKNLTALADVILLLNLFTSRDVFSFPAEELEDKVLLYDPRSYAVANMLRVAIKYKRGAPNQRGFAPNVNFEKSMNSAVALIRTREWRRKYRHGYVLFLARQAFKWQTAASSLLACFAIWEHVYSILNQNLSDSEIRVKSGKVKIAFVLHEFKFFDTPLSKNQVDRVDTQLVYLRNRIIHFGHLPTRRYALRDAYAFVELTSHLTARILNLTPEDTTSCIKRIKHVIGKP